MGARLRSRGRRGISGTARTWAKGLERRVPRQFLHAYRLHFDRPDRGAAELESPLPPDLATAAAWARGDAVAGE